MKKCPDCKIEMDRIDHDSLEIPIEPYWKCPKCRIEVCEECQP